MKAKQSAKLNYESRFTRTSTYDEANFLSRFWMGFVIPIFVSGVKHNGLELENLYRCPVNDEVERVKRDLERNWEQDKRKKNPSFAWTMFRTNIKHWIWPLLFFLTVECFIYIVQPLMLGLVIRHFNGDKTVDKQMAWLCVGGINACMLCTVLLDHPMIQVVQRLGCRWRVSASALIYQKSLKLSRASISQTAASQITNIMANDMSRFDEFCTSGMYLVVAPIQSAIIIYIVWTYLGVSTLVGLVVLLLFIPFQAVMGKFFSQVRLRTALLTDSRLKYMNEIVEGIRVIKQYCWEKPFADRVAYARKMEVSQIRKCCNLRAINLSLFFVATRIILFACFVVYVLLGGILSSEAVFVSMALFNTLRLTMTFFFPMAITLGSEILVVCSRIQKFLLLEENEVANQDNSATNSGEPHLKIEKITANWIKDQPQKTLQDISADLKPGDLLAVIGPVGSGKSSFLMTLLKELPIEAGRIELEGALSYASQDAWNFNDSARNNILFGKEFNKQVYRQVVEVCALQRDFKLMPDGDRTLVGEKGVSLSGGQKARINLARAVYRDSDIYLLDDPLSAVDTAVAEHIFEKCIMGYLSSKMRILVTHQIQFIEKANKILILKEGKCLAYGSYQEIQQMGIDFMSLLVKSEVNDCEDDKKERTMSELSGTAENCPKEPQSIDEMEFNEEKPIQLEEEQFQRGSIKGRIYAEYIRAGSGPILLSTMIIFTIISQAIFHGSDIFLTAWTNKNQALGDAKPDEEEQKMDIIFYSVFVVVLFISTVIRSVSFFAICMRASEVDEKLPYVAFDININFANIIGIIITVSIVNYFLVLPAIFLGIVSYYVRLVYIKSSRDIKRYEGITRSPVYSHLTNTISGLASIRAFGAQKSFEKQFYGYQNDHTSMWFLFIATSRAMGIVMEAICSLFIVTITLSVMFTENIEGGSAGLAISTGLMLAGMTQWGMRQSAEFENQMTSVERIVEYQELDQEAPAQSQKEAKPTEDWPSSGKIEFDHMSLAYGANAEKPVLKDIDCLIKGGEKIGIVGRTGAGKSSMIAALFRLTEPTGAIRIDGVNTNSIGLDDLRKKIAIIPQDPVIFSGTVRYNLDPFSEYPDSDLWAALEKVQLKTQVDNFTGKLEATLSEGGGNLSVGQRQLICLARAILRRNRILILDEATANVDHQTDSLIQNTIRTEFASCTALIVAHRLNTIIDCDRVLVLDAGEIVELDTPYQLLKNRGVFYSMCQKTGPSMLTHLYQLAKKAYQSAAST